MVTAMAVMDFLEKYGWQPHQISFMVNKTSTLIRGTTANLVEGQICTILDLLYGMMLPSGNDAAIALS
jgi:D-alanyl-D-alanine carboxypeptidase